MFSIVSYPRALPWAYMGQAFGLHDREVRSQQMRRGAAVTPSEESNLDARCAFWIFPNLDLLGIWVLGFGISGDDPTPKLLRNGVRHGRPAALLFLFSRFDLGA